MSQGDIPKTLRRSSLDISAEAINEIASQMTKLVADYFTGISNLPVFPQNYGGRTIEELDAELSQEGVPLEKLVAECRTIMNLSRHNGHPRFFGYVASPSTPIGAYADLVASALNANLTSWRSGPAGTEIERTLVRWLGSMVGFHENAHGLLTSGGSMANLIALLIASRTKSGTDISRKGLWNEGPPLTIYASEEIHMSVAKAIDILGFGREQMHTIECDNRMRINIDALRDRIQIDVGEGLRPFCVVGSAGTVNTGAVDPLNDIADVAAEFNLWFHVDGAYGAPGSLDRRKKALFAGLDRADSVSLDPHKWLYVPVAAGCLLLRDQAGAQTAFNTADADYIKVHGHSDEEAFAFWDYGIELSRRFRALKIWLTLRYYGVRRIAEAIAEDNSLAEYLATIVSKAADFELLAPVELSICCFRYLPAEFRLRLQNAAAEAELAVINEELDRFNERLMSAVQIGGRAYLSNATVHGRFALRACITNFRTTRADIDETIDVIRAVAAKMSDILSL